MISTFVLAQTMQEGDPEKNLKVAQDCVAKAMELYKPDFMVFPELFMSEYPSGTDRATCLGAAQHLDGPFVTGMRKLAKDNGIWMVFGMPEKVEDPDDDRMYNCTVMLNSDGDIVATYHKTHLYDAFGYKESDNNKPGDKFFEPVETPFGKIGLFVCYEVRFPEVARYQRKQGADIIIMPTAWVKGDLKSHQFRTLITARAIENTCYVLACDVCGVDSMGESVVVDPMGVPVATAGEVPTLICAKLDSERLEAVRKKLPAYKDRRPALYKGLYD